MRHFTNIVMATDLAEDDRRDLVYGDGAASFRLIDRRVRIR